MSRVERTGPHRAVVPSQRQGPATRDRFGRAVRAGSVVELRDGSLATVRGVVDELTVLVDGPGAYPARACEVLAG